MKRLVTMDPSHRLSRSMPLLLPHSSYLPPTSSYTATASRWAQRGRQHHRPRHYYIHGVRTTLVGADSYPNIHRYPQRIIVCGAGGVSFQKLTRSSSVLELSRTGVYSSTETVCGSRTARRAASCDDVSRGRHTPSWDSRCSESGVSLNDSRTDAGSDCRTGEAGSVGGLEDVDVSSQCSFGSSSAFHELTCDSELDRLDSDAVSGCGSLCGLERAEDEDCLQGDRDCLQGETRSKGIGESWGGAPMNSSHSPVSSRYPRPRCSPFDPAARFSKDPSTKTTLVHSPPSSPTLTTRKKELEKTKTGLTRFSYDPKRFSGCTENNSQQVCVSSAFRSNREEVESLLLQPAARGHSELNPTRLAPPPPPPPPHAAASGSAPPAAALISERHALNTQQQQQQQQQKQQHPPPSALADSHHRVTEWVQLLELGPIVKIPPGNHHHRLQEQCDVVKNGVESDCKQDWDSQNGRVSDLPAPVTQEGGRGEVDPSPPSASPDPFPPRGDGKKQPNFCEEEENATGKTILPLLTPSIKPPARLSSSSRPSADAAAATASEGKNNVDNTCERNGSSLRGGETATDCVNNGAQSSCVNECLAHTSSTANFKVGGGGGGGGGDDRNPRPSRSSRSDDVDVFRRDDVNTTPRLSSLGDVDVLRGGDVNTTPRLSSPSVDVLLSGVDAKPAPRLSSQEAVDPAGRGQTADGARDGNGGGGGGGNTIPAYHAVTRADRHNCSDPAGRFLSHSGRFGGSLSAAAAALEGEEKRGREEEEEEGGSVPRFSAVAVTACPTPSLSPSRQATYSCDNLSFPITNHHEVNCPFLPHPHHQPTLSTTTTTTTPALDRCGSSPTPLLPCRQVGRAQQDWRCTQSSAALSTHLEAFAHTLPPPPPRTGEKPRQLSPQSQSVGLLLPEQKGPEGSTPTVQESGPSQAGHYKDITGAARLFTGFPLTDATTKSDVTKVPCQGQGEFFVPGQQIARGELQQTVRGEKKKEKELPPATAGPTPQPPPFIAGEWRGRGQSPRLCEDATRGMSASNRSVTIPPALTVLPADSGETHVCFSRTSLQEKRLGERDPETTSAMAGNEHADNSNAGFNILDSLQQQLSMLSSEDTFNNSLDSQSCGESMGQVYWFRDHAEASLPHAHSESSSCVIQSSRSVNFTSETTSQWQQQQQQQQQQQRTAQISKSDFSSRDSFGGPSGASEWNVDYFSGQRHGSVVSNTKQEASFRHGRVSQAVTVWGKTVCEEGGGEGSGGLGDAGSLQSPPQSIQWQRPVSSSEPEDSDGNYTSRSSSTESGQHHSHSESEFMISDCEKEDYDNLDTFNDFVSGLQGHLTSDRPSQHHRTDLITSEFRSSRLRSCIQETILEADDESETADEMDTTTTTVSSYRSTFHYSLPQSTPKLQAVSPLPEIRLWSTDEDVTTLSSSGDRLHTMSPLHPLQDLSDKLSSFSDASFELHTLEDSFTLEDVTESRYSACSSPAPSDVSESSLYSSSATAEVRKQAESTTRVKMAETSQTVKAVRRNLSQTFALDTHHSVRSPPAATRPPAAKKAKWVEDNVFLFQKMLNDLESQCRSSEQALVEEMVSLECGRGGGGDAECGGGGVGQSSDSYDDLYRAFTQETLEKRQNHVCPFVEDHLPVLRFKRFLKKKHNSKLKGQRTFRVRHRLDKLTESPAAVGESGGGTSLDEGDSQNIERTITVITRGKPTPSLLPRLSSPTGIHDTAETPTFPDDDADADARRSLSDSAYSTLSDATSQPVSDLSSRGDDLSSITTDISLDSDKLASLNDVFDQLDVCEGEIDQALLDRLQVGHYKADTL